jgi:hypothetical protein
LYKLSLHMAPCHHRGRSEQQSEMKYLAQSPSHFSGLI